MSQKNNESNEAALAANRHRALCHVLNCAAPAVVGKCF